MTNDGQAIILFIDNSETSINGDFFPNRLDAQKIAVERLIQFFFRRSPNTQIGIGTLAEDSFGIVASLTTNENKLETAIANIKRGRTSHLIHGIRCGFLALHHCDPEVRNKRMIIFISSVHDMIDTKISSQLAQYANKEDVAVDIVIFGDEVNNVEILEDFVSKIHEKSNFVAAKSNSAILSDLVLSSPIGPGDVPQIDGFEDDPDLALTIKLSMQQDDDPELQAAILESQKDNIDDPELLAAILESQKENNNNQEANPKNQETSNNDAQDQDDIDDQELALAIKLSMQDEENKKNAKKDDDGNDKDKKDDK